MHGHFGFDFSLGCTANKIFKSLISIFFWNPPIRLDFCEIRNLGLNLFEQCFDIEITFRWPFETSKIKFKLLGQNIQSPLKPVYSVYLLKPPYPSCIHI